MKFGRTASRKTEELVDEFGQLVEEGKALLGAFAKQPLPKSTAVRDTVRDTLDAFNEKLADYQASATRAARQGAKRGTKYARRADQYVHDNPWPIVAGGIALGILASLWWNQRR